MQVGGESTFEYRTEWKCELAMEWRRVMRVKKWETKILCLTFRLVVKAGEEWVEYRNRTSREMRAKWRMMKLPTMAEKIAEKVWKTTAALCEGGRSRSEGVTIHSEVEDDDEVEEPECLGYGG